MQSTQNTVQDAVPVLEFPDIYTGDITALPVEEVITAVADAIANLAPTQEQVTAVGDWLAELPQEVIELKELLHCGMYLRLAKIPAGAVCVGKEVQVPTVSVVIGDITVSTDNGIQRLQGWNCLPALAGKKRIGVAHTDTYWATINTTTASTANAAAAEYAKEW